MNAQDLRDETVLFANFSIEEIDRLTALDLEIKNQQPIIFSNPATNTIYIKDIPKEVKLLKIFSIEGRQVMNEVIDLKAAVTLDVSSLPKGTYILNFIGKKLNQSALILIN